MYYCVITVTCNGDIDGHVCKCSVLSFGIIWITFESSSFGADTILGNKVKVTSCATYLITSCE